MVVPVTKPAPQLAGNPRMSSTHPSTISSSFAATGDMTVNPAFWSQTPAIQFAASAAGTQPPMTNPK